MQLVNPRSTGEIERQRWREEWMDLCPQREAAIVPYGARDWRSLKAGCELVLINDVCQGLAGFCPRLVGREAIAAELPFDLGHEIAARMSVGDAPCLGQHGL